MADDARTELFDLIVAAKPSSYSGDGFWIGDAIDAMRANPDVVLRALGGQYDPQHRTWHSFPFNWPEYPTTHAALTLSDETRATLLAESRKVKG